MSLATDLDAAAIEAGASAQAAKDRVAAAIAASRAETAVAIQALQDYIDSHPDESGVLQSALDGFMAADAIVDSIQAAPAEEPPAEEVPTP